MIRQFQAVLLIVALVFLSACAQLGITAPSTFDDKVYAAAETVNQVQISTASLVRAGKISADDAENVLRATNAAVAGITVARGYAATNPTAADAKLQAVLAALTLTQTYLATQQKAPAPPAPDASAQPATQGVK